MSAQEQDHWWFVARRAIIDSLVRTNIALPADARILEAGCGTGGNLALLAQYGALDAIEYDADARALAAARGCAGWRQAPCPTRLVSAIPDMI